MSIPAQYVVDNYQDEAFDKRHNSAGQVTGLRIVKSQIEILSGYTLKEKLEATRSSEAIDEEEGEKALNEVEWLNAEILVPYISKKGKKRLFDATSEQGLNMKIDRLKAEEAEKQYEGYLKGEKFSVANSGKLVRITLIGIPAEYSGVNILADVDRILGFPDYLAEKPRPKE